jgi:hypothetical protein
MKTTSIQIVIALVLIATGGLLWARGQDERERADAYRALSTLRYDQASLPEARYWAGDWEAIASDRDPFLAANAAYREATMRGGDWRALTTRLDGVIEQYGEILRNNPDEVDAAYNYEFAVRYRAGIAGRQRPVQPEEPDTTPHGVVGAPPPGTDMKQFKMIVPMRPDERQEAEQAGRNTRRMRKG